MKKNLIILFSLLSLIAFGQNGGVSVTNSTSTDDGTIRYNGDFQGLKAGQWTSLTGGSTGGSSLWTQGNASNIYYNGAGNVGIGTNTPSSPLHILKNGKAIALRRSAANANMWMEFQGATGAPLGQLWLDLASDMNLVSNIGDIHLVTGNNNLDKSLTVKYGGNVGINNDDPYYRLDISGYYNSPLDNNGGNMRILGFQPFIHLESTGSNPTNNSGISFRDATSVKSWIYRSNVEEGILISNGPTGLNPDLFIKDGGDVCIGRFMPADGYKLSVNGKIMCEELQVQLEVNWPDYVFSDNYNLRNLFQLEKFIDTNNHLPNIPTATEVEENGISVGEMQRLMMEKIEELTLYTIQQQKEIESLKAQLSEIN